MKLETEFELWDELSDEALIEFEKLLLKNGYNFRIKI